MTDCQALHQAFASRFQRSCEVVTRAPGRVNLIGEHTDYNDGFVLPIALEQATWVGGAARADGWARVASREMNDEQSWPLGGWQADRFPHWTSYVAGVASLLAQRGARLGGFDLLIASDVPVGGGLSSSAALEVASALALANLAGEPLESIELIDLCRQAEHRFAGVPCGIMDQYVCMLAKPDHALLLDCRSRNYEHIPLPLRDHAVLVVDSGVRHELAAGEYARRPAECRAAVEYFRLRNPAVRALRDVALETLRAHASQMDPLAAARGLHVTSENERTLAAAAALREGRLAELGSRMIQSHRSLREDYEVSCAELDQIVETLCRVEGVLGARMTGAGFGGCVVALVRDQSLEAAYAALGDSPLRRGGVIRTRAGAGATIESA